MYYFRSKSVMIPFVILVRESKKKKLIIFVADLHTEKKTTRTFIKHTQLDSHRPYSLEKQFLRIKKTFEFK